MQKSDNNFLFVVNIRCEPDEFCKLLQDAKIDYFNERVENVKYFYDELTYFIFDSTLTRQAFFDKINSYPKIKTEINEIQFCQKEEIN